MLPVGSIKLHVPVVWEVGTYQQVSSYIAGRG